MAKVVDGCPEYCGCGMPCVLKNHVKDRLGNELHACDVHMPQLHKIDQQLERSPFETIKLLAKVGKGEPALVAFGEIPPFNELPEVVMWGNRVFKLTKSTDSPKEMAEYTEVFAVAVVRWKVREQDEASYGGGMPRLTKIEGGDGTDEG